jgi:DNA-binding transcriptional LysR family regulator
MNVSYGELLRGYMDRSLIKIDMNLLRALHVLLEERSVTRAAEKLFITQPAMSKSLQRLRNLLDDPLFIRSPRGLLPTPKAEQLAMPLKAVFEQMEMYLSPTVFDPALIRGSLRIAAPEQFALGAIPQLLTCVIRKAPRLSIESLHLMDEYLDLLAAGTLDFAINLDQHYPDQFIAHPLFSAAPKIWFRHGHPLARKNKIGLADMFAYRMIGFQHQNVTAQVSRAIELCVSDAGLTADVLLDTSHLLIAIDTLVKTDAVMVAPDYISSLSVYRHEIVQRTLDHIPVFDHLRMNLSLVQHTRTANSHLHRWLISEIGNALSASQPKQKIQRPNITKVARSKITRKKPTS